MFEIGDCGCKKEHAPGCRGVFEACPRCGRHKHHWIERPATGPGHWCECGRWIVDRKESE